VRECSYLLIRRHPCNLRGNALTTICSLHKVSVKVSPISEQLSALFIIAMPVASISWTVTHEEVFREPRDWCIKHSKVCQKMFERKFFYLFTCEYCFSHYISAIFVFLSRYTLLFPDWRGYLIALFSLVWVANLYMSIFGRVRLGIRRERMDIEHKEHVRPDTTGNLPLSGMGMNG
jgi:hypothetical protein